MDGISISERTIDIEDVFRKKNPGLIKFIPGFVFGYLRKKIHEKEINSILFNYRELIGLDFLDMLVREFGAIIQVDGAENVPAKGRYLIASNHPLGGLDGVALMHVVGKIRKDLIFPVNDILLFLPNLRPLFVPINKHGTNTENLGLIREAFASDKIMLYFPAGLVSRKQKGKVEDLPWKKTFLSKAIKFERDIIPAYIDGRNSTFFYYLANLRKKLNIKANVEMLFLPDEMFRQKNKVIRITFGKPIRYNIFDTQYTQDQWTQKIRNYVYAMKDGPLDPFDPEKEYGSLKTS
jgi:putative hemolysin